MVTPLQNSLLAATAIVGATLTAWSAEPPPLHHARVAAAPVAVGVEPGASEDLFRTADRCLACHKGVSTSEGVDVSIGYDWRASMMANSARDPYWQAAVRREITDHPEASEAIEAKCSRCHMPMASVVAEVEGRALSVFANLPVAAADDAESLLAADGVSCAACHQIAPDGLGSEASFTGGFTVSDAVPPEGRPVYGPFEPDEGGAGIMHSATGFVPTESSHIQDSELCASCHTLFTHALQADGGEGPEFPEQVPYLEWQASSYADNGTSCQDCHMPEVTEDVPVTQVLGRARPEVSRHVFRGGNFFMLRMLNRYRGELGVTALPQELELAASRTEQHLRDMTAEISVTEVGLRDGRIEAVVEIRNEAGHKFPTAYPSRRAWLHLTVRDGRGGVAFESGAFSPDGRITGNDNDADATRYEPHYQEITEATQVQIYEAVMLDGAGRVTTGLMSAEGWAKENRLLPEGFDPSRTSDTRIGVVGNALSDDDFEGGVDRVRYSVSVDRTAGPFTVTAEVWFQPIGFRWAETLAGYETFETDRFVRYYRAMAGSSAILLARDSAQTR